VVVFHVVFFGASGCESLCGMQSRMVVNHVVLY
jgi:hypothetical protein